MRPLLLDRGADANAVNDEGKTADMIATDPKVKAVIQQAQKKSKNKPSKKKSINNSIKKAFTIKKKKNS